MSGGSLRSALTKRSKRRSSRRVDRGDAEAIADRRIGGGAAPLAEDALSAREAHDVVDGEEIGRVAELADKCQLVLELRPHLAGNARGITLGRPGPALAREVVLRRKTVGAGIDGVFVTQLVEGEMRALDDLQRAQNRVRVVAEEARHLVGRFEMALRIGKKTKARLIDRAVLADAGEHVLERTPRRGMRVHVVGRDEGDAEAPGELGQALDARAVVAAIEMVGGEIEAVAERGLELVERALEIPAKFFRRQCHDELPFGVGEEVGERQAAFALLGPALAAREQGREPAVSGAVAGIGKEARPVLEIETRADDEAQARLARRRVRAHDTRERIAVRHGKCSVAELGGALHQLLRMRGAAEEAEVARHLQLGVRDHG